MAVQPGRYRHYKGNYYEVIGTARHSETDELLVVYRPLYGERGLWVRPAAMFLEEVSVEGRSLPRFARCEEEQVRGLPGLEQLVEQESKGDGRGGEGE